MTVLCNVCDGEDAMDVFLGHPMHTECAPEYLRKDREKAEQFAADIERRKSKGEKR